MCFVFLSFALFFILFYDMERCVEKWRRPITLNRSVFSPFCHDQFKRLFSFDAEHLHQINGRMIKHQEHLQLKCRAN